MYVRKTKDVYCVEIDYGYGDGFEPVFETDNKISAQLIKEDYIRNDIFAKRIRVKKHRIKIINGETYYVWHGAIRVSGVNLKIIKKEVKNYA